MTLKNVEYEQAIGIAAMPWIVPQRVGNSLKGILTNLAVFGFVAYATIMETEYAAVAVMILAGFGLTHGLLVLFSPNFHALLWGNVQSDDDKLHFARRCLGCDLIPVAVYMWALIAGVPNPQALGYGWASVFLAFLTLLGDFKKSNVDMNLIYAWVVAMAIVALTLTADVPEEAIADEKDV
ncbi:MAG: hypothetical protein SGARI_002744 [Bacillariaceae sp.]